MADRKAKPTLAEAAAKGDRRAALGALRDRLAAAVTDCPTTQLAALARQLTEVLRELDGLPGEEKSKRDELADRRAKRRAAVSKRPAKRVVGGKGSGRARGERGSGS